MSNPLERRGRATETTDGMLFGVGRYAILEKHRWRTPPNVVESIARRLGIEAFDLDACAEDDARWADRWITLAEDCLRLDDWRRTHRYEQDSVFHRNAVDTSVTVEVVAPGVLRYKGPPDARIRHVFMNSPWGGAGISAPVRKAVQEWDPGYDLQPFPGTYEFIAQAWRQSRLGMTVAVLVGVSLDAWQRDLCRLADEVWFGPRIRFQAVDGSDGPHPPGPTMVLIFRPHVPDAGWPGGPRVDFAWTP